MSAVLGAASRAVERAAAEAAQSERCETCPCLWHGLRCLIHMCAGPWGDDPDAWLPEGSAPDVRGGILA
jgi:hypothetical protein